MKTQQLMQDATEEFLLAGGMIHQLYGITEEELEALYIKASQEYKAQHYVKALDAFSMLVHLKADEKRYLFAFAATLQLLKEYKKAFFYYSMAAQQDLSDPIITLHMVECLIRLNMDRDALSVLEVLIQETVDQPNYQKLYEKALGYQALLQQKSQTLPA